MCARFAGSRPLLAFLGRGCRVLSCVTVSDETNVVIAVANDSAAPGDEAVLCGPERGGPVDHIGQMAKTLESEIVCLLQQRRSIEARISLTRKTVRALSAMVDRSIGAMTSADSGR
jgi:alanine racemase